MCDKSRNTWLCVHWQWNTLEWCQLNALQASPVVHLVTPLSCVSLSMNTQASVPTILFQNAYLHVVIKIFQSVSVWRGFETICFLWFITIFLSLTPDFTSHMWAVSSWMYQSHQCLPRSVVARARPAVPLGLWSITSSLRGNLYVPRLHKFIKWFADNDVTHRN